MSLFCLFCAGCKEEEGMEGWGIFTSTGKKRKVEVCVRDVCVCCVRACMYDRLNQI